jgi:hypothetical protein
MIRAADSNLAVTTDKTIIIPGHGQPVGNRSELEDYRMGTVNRPYRPLPACLDMLAELCNENKQLAAHMRETHGLCDEHGDVANASLLETWIDEAERRTWFLFEAGRPGEPVGHAGDA